MKKSITLVMMLSFGMLSASLQAAEKDAADCKDHPLLPRLPGYYIVACATSDASFDMEPAQGKSAGTVHVEGKSRAIAYGASAALQPKPDREKILGSFENAVKKYDGALVGRSNSIPIYRLVDGGREIWVAVLADSTGGGYAYRIIEKEGMVQTKKDAAQNDNPACAQYGPPPFAPLAGYQLCGCGGQESSSREVKIAKGKTAATVRIQGRQTQMTYCPHDESASPGELQIRRKFENDIRQQGGSLVGKTTKNPQTDVYRLARNGGETWIEVWTENSGNYNYVVTKKGN